jgi:flagellar protein FlaG
MRVNGVDQKIADPIVQKAKTGGQEVQFFKPGKSAEPEQRPVGEKKSGVSNDEIFRAIEKANERVMNRSTELRFSVHERTKEVMIKVMNTETQEIIREIPSEKILDMVANFMEIAGLYVDEEA